MKQKPGLQKLSAEEAIKDIRRATPRHWSAEDKIKIVLEGLRGEDSIAELCRREGIVALQHYGWPKEFLEAGKRRLAGDTAREATSGEVKDLRREMQALKEVAADLTPDNRLLKKKKAPSRMGETTHELLGIRKGRDHSSRRAIRYARKGHPETARDSARHVLRVV